MIAVTDTDLYQHGAETLLASWEEYARGVRGASVQRFAGVATAVFPNEPERGVYNNAVLECDLVAAARSDAIHRMEDAYAAVGVTRFAAWVHESDPAMRADLQRRGYTLDTSTRAMGMALEDLRTPRSELDLGVLEWSGYLRVFGLPPGLLAEANHAALHLLVARVDGESVATALAFDLDRDCGIYNVTILQSARRRGLGTALTAVALHEAQARGCWTASLQSTEMAEGIYTAVGFRDLGRFLEYVPYAGG